MMNRRLLSLLLVLSLLMSLTAALALTPGTYEGEAKGMFDGVKVKKVNTMNVNGKLKRQGRFTGYTPNWKKAVVTIKEGQRIPIFEE